MPDHTDRTLRASPSVRTPVPWWLPVPAVLGGLFVVVPVLAMVGLMGLVWLLFRYLLS